MAVSKHSWQAHLNPVLVARLTRPKNRPGLVKSSLAQQLRCRVNNIAIAPPTLANKLLQRQTRHAADAATLPPLVYPQRIEPSPASGADQPKLISSPDTERPSLRRTVATRSSVNPESPSAPLGSPSADVSPFSPNTDAAGTDPESAINPIVTTQQAAVKPTISRPVVRPNRSQSSSVLRRSSQPNTPSRQPTKPPAQSIGNPTPPRLSAPTPNRPVISIPPPPLQPKADTLPAVDRPFEPSSPIPAPASEQRQSETMPQVQASFAPEISPSSTVLVYAPVVMPVEQSSVGEIRRSPSPKTTPSNEEPSTLDSFERITTDQPQPLPPPPSELPSVDEVVDKALRKLSRRLAVEQERQGGKPWC